MSNNPLISVVMSVYNTDEVYLRDAIESILNQTYRNFEFLIINDGCNEQTYQVLKEYDDSRISIINNQENIGLTKSLNKGIKLSKGKYIARMDADDVSLPKRFEYQVKYMEANQDIAVLGSWIISNNETYKFLGSNSSKYREVRMLFENAGICHPTAFIRRSFLLENDICYDERIKKSQDYKLWVDILKNGKMAVIPEVLLNYRYHPQQISVMGNEEQKKYDKFIREELFEEICPTLKYEEKEQLLQNNKIILSPAEVIKTIHLLEKENKHKKIYDCAIFKFEMFNFWKRYVKTYIKEIGFDNRLIFNMYNLQWLNCMNLFLRLQVDIRKNR